MRRMLQWFVCLLLAVSPVTTAGASPATRVTFESGALSLVAYLYHPEGSGPWPALIWNHGSEKDPAAGPQFEAVASTFVSAGYLVFAPVRRGHGESQGDYVVDQVKFALKLQGKDAANRLTVRLLETEQLADQLAALAYVKQLPFVDSERIVVAGCSYGGIEALLGAESGAGYKAAISISPAALSWERNDYLQARLVKAVGRIDIPVLLIQPPKDASLEPARVLGAAAARAGKPLTAKVYPATGSPKEQGHCFGGASGMHVWVEDAKGFLRANLPWCRVTRLPDVALARVLLALHRDVSVALHFPQLSREALGLVEPAPQAGVEALRLRAGERM
jgi:carboxymethylenebutenolidase